MRRTATTSRRSRRSPRGVLLAQMAHAAQGRVDLLAAGFVAARLGYTAAYLADWATVRSALWLAGLVCTVLLFVVAAAVH